MLYSSNIKHFNRHHSSLGNNDSAAHLATSGTPDGGPDGAFDSGMIMAGATYEFEFSDKGEFVYYCLVHPWMIGTVIVE